MKFNKWTLGLAAVGAVSMASAVRADEAKLSALNTALSNTTISGYVDVAANYVAGNQYQTEGYYGNIQKDGFTFDNVTISLDKPLDESPWAAGYHIDLNAGDKSINGLAQEAAYWQTGSGTFAVRQAYVALRTPVGNGIDWKIGVMDGVTGYESNTGYANPNYSRSFGYAINPASMVGLVGTYKVSDLISATAGIVNRGVSQGYGQDNWNISSKDYVATLSLTAPDSLGFLKGSVLNLGTIQSFDNQGVNNYSANATFNTPVAGLKFGLAYDVLQSLATPADGNIFGVYASFQATDKLGLHLRGEYVDTTDLNFFSGNGKGTEVTATVQYDLWANVVSRLEFRWDHVEQGTQYDTAGYESANENLFQVAINIVYKF